MRFQQFLEVKGEKAHRDAVAMGLQYKGFGYWADPNTGEAKYKTVNDQLVPVEPDVESEKWRGDGPDAAAAGGGAAPQGGMMQPGADGAPGAPPVGSGENIQGGLGVDARAPQKKGWDSGPDGDTCVGGQPREDIPVDAFVGKTNNLKWTAGPDGSNAMELGEMRQAIAEAEFNRDRKAHADNVSYAAKNGLPADAGTETKNDYNNFIGPGEQRGGQRGAWLKGYLKRLRGEPESPPETQSKTTYDSITPTATEYSDDESVGFETPSWVGAGSPKAQDTDNEQVRMMNEAIKDIAKDGSFDLDSLDDLDPVASGAFGQFRIGPGGIGVKKGQIGPGELAALAAMRDHPAFPTLINARFDSPFMDESAGYNNPEDTSGRRRGTEQSKYFDARDYDMGDWNKKFPTAWGKYAMSVAKGEQISSVFGSLPDEIKQKAIKNFWKARGELHKAGFAHNDMHGGNVMVDPESGEVSILDLGLAEEDPFSALMEAAGGFDAEEGEDSQLAWHLRGPRIPEELRDRMIERLGGLNESLLDSYDGDMEDEERFDDAMRIGGGVLRGGIRMNNEKRQQILEYFPKLGDREFVMPLIEKLYEGLTDYNTGEPEEEPEQSPRVGLGFTNVIKNLFVNRDD